MDGKFFLERQGGQMTRSIESKVNSELLERMLDWAKDIDEFERHHAADGLFLAAAFCVPPFAGDEEGFFLIALDIAFWCWIDDRSDKHLLDQTVRFDWAGLIESIEENTVKQCSGSFSTQEEDFYFRLSELIKDRAADEADYNYWRLTMTQVARGMFFEEQVSRVGRKPSFVECVEYGQLSTGLPNFIAVTGLVHSISRFARQIDVHLTTLERCFCIQQRMLNDLDGTEKEREEGKISNCVLLMEQNLGPEKAAAFVRDEMAGLEQIIRAMCDRLGHHDPFTKLILHAKDSINKWYAAKPLRCGP